MSLDGKQFRSLIPCFAGTGCFARDDKKATTPFDLPLFAGLNTAIQPTSAGMGQGPTPFNSPS